jgi:alkylation response protein AidB-like acyl-CoA dehydrogenase
MHFNEVFLTDVRLPAAALLQPQGGGWAIATRMLSHQRVARGTGQVGGIRTDRTDRLRAEARARGVAGDPLVRQELARLHTAEVCHSVMAQRTRAALGAGSAPGPGGSLAKLAGTLIAARYRDLSLRIVGPDSVAWSDGGGGGHWAEEALWTLSLGIAGGTSEVQRNIIGERVLGLPREPQVDRDVPFRQLGARGR